MPIVLSIEGITADDRAELWHGACAVGELVVSEIDASAQLRLRTPRLIHRSDEQYLLLGMQTRGTGRVAEGDHRTLLHPGDCALFESHRPFELNVDAAFDLWVFAFPRHLVRLSERDRRQLAAQPVDCRNGLSGVASRALLDLAQHSEDLRGPPPGAALALANDLLAALFSARLSENRQPAGSLQRTLPLRIKHYIDQRLAETTLDPAQVAAAFGISTRYLHRLFESEQETVGRYIRDRRLELCRLRLLDPRFSHHSISTLAFGSGFGDLSGFNRAFKAKYGVSPRQLRTPDR